MIADGVLTLARTVYGEARGETFEGKVAVAHVIINRFRSAKWFAGDTLAATCLKSKQFSSWNDGDPNRALMMDAVLTEKVFAECLYAALGALLGRIPDPTGGSTHYHASNVHPDWAKGHTSVATIGAHLFYRGIN